MTIQNSEHVEGLIQAYLDGELDDVSNQTVREHCSRCSSCALVLQECDRVSSLLREDSDTQLPRPMWPSVREAIAPRERARFDRVIALGGFAVAFAGLVLGLAIGSMRPATAVQEADNSWQALGATLTGDSRSALLDTQLSIYLEEGDSAS